MDLLSPASLWSSCGTVKMLMGRLCMEAQSRALKVTLWCNELCLMTAFKETNRYSSLCWLGMKLKSCRQHPAMRLHACHVVKAFSRLQGVKDYSVAILCQVHSLGIKGALTWTLTYCCGIKWLVFCHLVAMHAALDVHFNVLSYEPATHLMILRSVQPSQGSLELRLPGPAQSVQLLRPHQSAISFIFSVASLLLAFFTRNARPGLPFSQQIPARR